MLIDILLDNALQVLGIVEECLNSLQDILGLVQQLLALLTGLGLDTADTGSYTALRDNLEESDATCARCVDTTAELAARTEANHTYLVAVLLAEQGDSTELLSLVEWYVTMLVDVDILTDHIVHHTLYLAQLLVGNLLEV